MNKITGFLYREKIYLALIVFLLIVTGTIRTMRYDVDSKKAAAAAPGTHFSSNDLLVGRDQVEKKLLGDPALLNAMNAVSLFILAIVAAGIVLDGVLVSRYISRGSGIFLSRGTAAVSWGLGDILHVVIIFAFVSKCIAIGEEYLAGIFPAIKHDNLRMVVNVSILDTAAVALILWHSVLRYRVKLSELGITVNRFGRNVAFGVAGYLALVPVLILILMVTALVIRLTGVLPDKQPIVDLFLTEKDTFFLTYTGFFAAIAGPFIEELFFRGFMYPALKKKFGVFLSIVVTAAIFAALHAQLAGFAPIMALGVLLCVVYELTGSLVAPIAVHIVHNAGMIGLIFLVKKVSA